MINRWRCASRRHCYSAPRHKVIWGRIAQGRATFVPFGAEGFGMRDEVLEPVEVTGSDTVKRRAMSFMERAFDEADAEDVPVDAVAHAALFAALTTLVECFGEESVARMVSELPDRITTGSYTMDRILQ